MARVLVTGVAGFVGSHVAEALLEAGHDVVGVDNFSTGRVGNIPKGVDWYEWDIREPLQEKNIDYVFHLACLARIQPSIEDPITSHLNNVDGTLEILEFCRKQEAKLIFSSSSSIFKGDELPTNEKAPTHPRSPYALQKLQCEEYIKLYRDLYGLKYAILRYFNVFGERQITQGAYAAVVGIFLKQKSKGFPLTITNDGEQRRDFTYVKDVAQANLKAMNWLGEFNIGTGKNYSINEIAKAVGGKRKYIGERIGEARNTLADSSKAQAKGWEPTKNILEWINETAS